MTQSNDFFVQSMLILILALFMNTVQANEIDNLGLSLGDLFNIDITIASRHSENIFETPSAAYVITQEDIRRSGMSSIPELLRLVPGFGVGQIDGNIWSLSSRGFKDSHSDKLLVLVDGRSVYTPMFGGVYWDVQGYLLEDIEQIEIIRGPGATLWGANAVNGIVNIITKNSYETEGGLAVAGKGTNQEYLVGGRYGGWIGDNLSYRFYVKNNKRTENLYVNGEDAFDGTDVPQVGFYINWDKDNKNRLSFHGDYYDGTRGLNKWREDENVAGGNVVLRWEHSISDTSDFSLQFYYDRTERHSSIIGEDRNTYDLDMQHNFTLGGNDIIWGMAYRYTGDETDEGSRTLLNPVSDSYATLSVFIQDKISLVDNHLRLTFGSKFEDNSYTGFEYQPSIKLMGIVNSSHSTWASISRAIKTPNRIDRDFDISMGFAGPFEMFAKGNKDMISEKVIAYEVGYRFKSKSTFSLDIAAFYNDYEDIFSKNQTTDAVNKQIIFSFANDRIGKTYGFETLANWQIAPSWKLSTSWSFLEMDITVPPEDLDAEAELEGVNPQNQMQIRSYWDINNDWEFDIMAFYVDEIFNGEVDDYLRLDLRLGWNLRRNLELSIGVQNALDSKHPEDLATRRNTISEIERNVWGKVTWQF